MAKMMLTQSCTLFVATFLILTDASSLPMETFNMDQVQDIETLTSLEQLEDTANNYRETVRIPREIKFQFPGSDKIPPPPTALCFRQPCNLSRGFQRPTQGRFRRSLEPEVLNKAVRVRRGTIDDKGFKDFTPDSNTRGMLYGTKSFGPNSHGGWQSTAKIEHDVWKSNDGNRRVLAYGRHDRIDGGRFDGFKESKFGIGYQHRFRRDAHETS